MLVLGLQGSPRKKGNTDYLLGAFMAEAEKMGAATRVLDVNSMDIVPCQNCGQCEKKGVCMLDDDMKRVVYPLLRKADVVVAASPIFFYNVTAQLKALIDRSQTLWSRKYSLGLSDPLRNARRGYLLALGATKGKNLFEGTSLTAKYFFDAIDASFDGQLTYRRIENRGDMENHPTVLSDVETAARNLLSPLVERKKVLFVCRDNAFLSQAAGAFARKTACETLDIATAGFTPAEELDSRMLEVMEGDGIDMALMRPRSAEVVLESFKPDIVIKMSEGDLSVPGAEIIQWDFSETELKQPDAARNVCREIEKKVGLFTEGVK